MALTKLGKTWYDANVIDNVLESDDMVATSRYSYKTNLLRKDGNTIIRNLRKRRLSRRRRKRNDERVIQTLQHSIY